MIRLGLVLAHVAAIPVVAVLIVGMLGLATGHRVRRLAGVGS